MDQVDINAFASAFVAKVNQKGCPLTFRRITRIAEDESNIRIRYKYSSLEKSTFNLKDGKPSEAEFVLNPLKNSSGSTNRRYYKSTQGKDFERGYISKSILETIKATYGNASENIKKTFRTYLGIQQKFDTLEKRCEELRTEVATLKENRTSFVTNQHAVTQSNNDDVKLLKEIKIDFGNIGTYTIEQLVDQNIDINDKINRHIGASLIKNENQVAREKNNYMLKSTVLTYGLAGFLSLLVCIGMMHRSGCITIHV